MVVDAIGGSRACDSRRKASRLGEDSCGWSGSAGGTLAGFQRGAKAVGRPVPTTTTGTPGQGRADRLRSYTVHAVRDSDKKRLEETVGPGYHSRKVWRTKCEEAQKRLMRQLGWRP